MAKSPDELQEHLVLCGGEGTEFGLCFNVKKSAAISFGSAALQILELYKQGNFMVWASEYQYLGITITVAPNHMQRYE